MKLRATFLLTALALPACRDDGSQSDDDTDATDTDAESRVTFWDDVAPIYVERCVSCHRDGGIAPFALDNYADASAWAGASADAVAERVMPPWLVTADGSCGDFHEPRALADDEIETIVAWRDGGTLEGDPRDDLVAPTQAGLSGATTYATPQFSPEIVGGPLAQFDEYRCFLIDPNLDGDRYVTGYEVLPGNEAIVHHVLVYTVDPAAEAMPGVTNREIMQGLDDESPDRDGWPCFEGAGDGTSESGLPVAWAPGQGVVELPDGTGMRVAADEVFVAQVHYNLADPATEGATDRTEIRLRLEAEVERPGFMVLPDLFLGTLFDEVPAQLEPGMPSVPYTWELPVAGFLADTGLESVDLYGVLPHMHQLGSSIGMTIAAPEAETCAVNVPRWDFDWQFVYFYDEPRRLDGDDILRVTCDYDTRGVTEPVLPGWGTHNEMCLMGLFVVP